MATITVNQKMIEAWIKANAALRLAQMDSAGKAEGAVQGRNRISKTITDSGLTEREYYGIVEQYRKFNKDNKLADLGNPLPFFESINKTNAPQPIATASVNSGSPSTPRSATAPSSADYFSPNYVPPEEPSIYYSPEDYKQKVTQINKSNELRAAAGLPPLQIPSIDELNGSKPDVLRVSPTEMAYVKPPSDFVGPKAGYVDGAFAGPIPATPVAKAQPIDPYIVQRQQMAQVDSAGQPAMVSNNLPPSAVTFGSPAIPKTQPPFGGNGKGTGVGTGVGDGVGKANVAGTGLGSSSPAKAGTYIFNPYSINPSGKVISTPPQMLGGVDINSGYVARTNEYGETVAGAATLPYNEYRRQRDALEGIDRKSLLDDDLINAATGRAQRAASGDPATNRALHEKNLADMAVASGGLFTKDRARIGREDRERKRAENLALATGKGAVQPQGEATPQVDPAVKQKTAMWTRQASLLSDGEISRLEKTVDPTSDAYKSLKPETIESTNQMISTLKSPDFRDWQKDFFSALANNAESEKQYLQKSRSLKTDQEKLQYLLGFYSQYQQEMKNRGF